MELVGGIEDKGSPAVQKKNSLSVPDVVCVEETLSNNGSMKSGNGKSVATENGIVRKFLKSFSVEEKSYTDK